MAQPAERLSESTPAATIVRYEHPLSERMRTYLRIEALYRELRFNLERESQWASRRAVANLLDIAAILSRGDMRSDMLKEVERQNSIFDRFKGAPDVDEKRIAGILSNLHELRKDLIGMGPQYLNHLRESEFLNAIKHRSTIPGGTCEFDLPAFSHWLRQPYERRRTNLCNWINNLLPLCDSVAELLWLFRSSGSARQQVAVNGVFHYALERGAMSGLVRIALPAGTDCFPEISGGRHRFSIRFKNWPDSATQSRQMISDVVFDLTIC
jgi:cell division protein ZapD